MFKYKNILVTGGAGFVGSNLCIKFKEYYPDINIIALDNLIRSGSELNVPRLGKYGIKFIKGDVRYKNDLETSGKIDLLIECSAEPSVMAGVGSSPEYLIHTNLFGAVNCFEYSRVNQADVVFLSTSRIYPYDLINSLKYRETDTRFEIDLHNKVTGLTQKGISETFTLNGIRSMYGATKLSAEFLLLEYAKAYGINTLIDRFGVIAGPWQMGKVDQGFLTYWLSAFIYDKKLSYFGFGGKGKQVRDVIHIDDVFELLLIQLNNINKYSGEIYNTSGGYENSVSLYELTIICQNLTHKKLLIESDKNIKLNDLIYYIGDNTKLKKISGWYPKKNLSEIVIDIYNWIQNNKKFLAPIFDNANINSKS